MEARQKRLIGGCTCRSPSSSGRPAALARLPFRLQALLRSVSLMNRSGTTHRAEQVCGLGVRVGVKVFSAEENVGGGRVPFINLYTVLLTSFSLHSHHLYPNSYTYHFSPELPASLSC